QLAADLGLHAVRCLPSLDDAGRFEPSAPELWLAALASGTERIRLVWGLAGLLPPERPPIHVAEQGASIDLASQGRLELALLPESAPLVEAGSAEAAAWDEGVRMLVAMWDVPAFSWRSARFAVEPVDIVPKPVQRPHPPLWLAGWRADQAARAGRGGLGFLDVSGAPDEALAMHRAAYLEARAESDSRHLVCESAFAAALDVSDAGREMRRLAEWESMGIDQAVVRIGTFEGGHREALRQIRGLARDGL
ncbi:MAG: LLM class flavin-dependent oxidoreductase, partial [bacterium]